MKLLFTVSVTILLCDGAAENAHDCPELTVMQTGPKTGICKNPADYNPQLVIHEGMSCEQVRLSVCEDNKGAQAFLGAECCGGAVNAAVREPEPSHAADEEVERQPISAEEFFNTFDENSDGEVTLTEALEAFKRYISDTPGEVHMFRCAFSKFAATHNGGKWNLDRSALAEFIGILNDPTHQFHMEEQSPKDMFCSLDVDGNGLVTMEEAAQQMVRMGMSDQEAQMASTAAGTWANENGDKDGALSLTELTDFLGTQAAPTPPPELELPPTGAITCGGMCSDTQYCKDETCVEVYSVTEGDSFILSNWEDWTFTDWRNSTGLGAYSTEAKRGYSEERSQLCARFSDDEDCDTGAWAYKNVDEPLTAFTFCDRTMNWQPGS